MVSDRVATQQGGYRLRMEGIRKRFGATIALANLPGQVPIHASQVFSGNLTALVEEFWWESTYVAKNLWRDQLLPAGPQSISVKLLDAKRTGPAVLDLFGLRLEPATP